MLMKKFDLKIIGVYTFVEILFALGLKNFVFILYGDALNGIIVNGNIKGFTQNELSIIFILFPAGALIGLLLSFIISFIISIRYKLGVINSIIAFIIGVIVNRFILMKIIISPGQVLVDSIFTSAIIDLSLFTLFGIGIYYKFLKMRRKMHNHI